jgi:serine acetyltransferase
VIVLSQGLAAMPAGPRALSKPLSLLVEAPIELPYQASIVSGLYLGDFGNIIVYLDAVIGSGCNISQGLTIGVSGRGVRRSAPILGELANAVIRPSDGRSEPVIANASGDRRPGASGQF